MLPLLVLCLFAVTCLSAQHGAPGWETASDLLPGDYDILHSLKRRSNSGGDQKFGYVFVSAGGIISNSKGKSDRQIEVVRSPLASKKGLNAAADVAANMTKYMPSSIFKKLASTNSLGVYTAAEKLTIFPEYEYLANGKCGRSCTGPCSNSCTPDGRKWEDIAGIGGKKAAVLEDNLLCTAEDPYGGSQSMLSLEFAHTIFDYALSGDTKQNIRTAYNKAKDRKTWVLSSVAMEAVDEYFAESTTAFFYVSINNKNSGGMNFCGEELCSSEQATREHLREKDPALYKILSYVYTDNRPSLTSGLKRCP